MSHVRSNSGKEELPSLCHLKDNIINTLSVFSKNYKRTLLEFRRAKKLLCKTNDSIRDCILLVLPNICECCYYINSIETLTKCLMKNLRESYHVSIEL